MRFSRSEPGFALSAAVHLGLLLILLVHFSQDQKFEDASEAVPVDTISESQFREIMQGEKSAPKADKARVDKVADKSETAPPQTKAPAKPDVPTPPPPLQRQADPGEDDHKSTPAPTPTPPTPPTPTPPPRPVPPPPIEKPPVPTPPQKPVAPQPEPDEPDDAEVVKPKPPPKPPEKPVPKPPEKPVEKPVPKPPEKPPEKPVEKPSPKTRTEEKAKLDQVAKLLSESKSTDKPSETPPAKPKSGSAEAPSRPGADLSAISKLVASQAPDAKFATGREISRQSAQGAAHATGAKMSPSLSDALNSLLQEQYKSCWSYLPLTGGGKYVAKIKVSYLPDGSLNGQPTLLNPPSDPAFRGLAESALRAVRRCNPLRIPAQYQPYYDQWKDWVVGFDPEILN